MQLNKPVEGVLFDFHGTLVDQGHGDQWLRAAWAKAGRGRSPTAELAAKPAAEIVGVLEDVWAHARRIDPESERDTDPRKHRQIFGDVLAATPAGEDQELVDALYETLFDHWHPYADTLGVLEELKACDVPVALVSNVGCDPRQLLQRLGLDTLLDAVVLSFDLGVVKPAPAIFESALTAIGIPAESALMVGDNAHDDSGAIAVGIRTLLLPRPTGSHRGLDAVLALIRQ